MSVKRMSEVREMAVEVVQAVQFQGFQFLGRSSEGLVFESVEGEEFFVVKVVVKKEGFEAVEAVEEFEEKQAQAVEKARLAEEKKVKAKAKKEKE